MEDNFDKVVCDFIKSYNFTSQNNNKEVFTKINKFLQKEYKGRAPKEHIKHIAEDITESICIKLNIPC